MATCTDLAGNSSQVSITLKIDVSAPTVTMTTPPGDGSGFYIVNQPLVSSFTCTDALSGVASCLGNGTASGSNIDTSTVGTKSFTFVATDKAGNTFSKTVSYKVVYMFAGFFSPLATACDVSNTSCSSNSGNINKGSAIPLKFTFTDFNGNVVNLAPAGVFSVVAVPNPSGTGGPSTLAGFTFCGSGGCTGKSTERFSSGQYIVNADTSALAAGYYNIIVKLPGDVKAWWTIVNVQ
jgi:hypothetical protein